MNLTPRKFKSQLDVHADIQKRMHGTGNNESTQSAYIDQIPGW